MSDVRTRLIIQGDHESLKDFIIKATGETNLDFYNFLPLPFELKHTIYPIKIISEQKYQALWQQWIAKKQLNRLSYNEKYSPRIGMTSTHYQYLVEKYGYSNWAEWTRHAFGTKTNPYDVGEWMLRPNYATLVYSTQWSPASSFYQYVSKLYPLLMFKHEFVDDQDVYIGNETFKNGVMISFHDYEYDSTLAQLLRISFDL